MASRGCRERCLLLDDNDEPARSERVGPHGGCHRRSIVISGMGCLLDPAKGTLGRRREPVRIGGFNRPQCRDRQDLAHCEQENQTGAPYRNHIHATRSNNDSPQEIEQSSNALVPTAGGALAPVASRVANSGIGCPGQRRQIRRRSRHCRFLDPLAGYYFSVVRKTRTNALASLAHARRVGCSGRVLRARFRPSCRRASAAGHVCHRPRR